MTRTAIAGVSRHYRLGVHERSFALAQTARNRCMLHSTIRKFYRVRIQKKGPMPLYISVLYRLLFLPSVSRTSVVRHEVLDDLLCVVHPRDRLPERIFPHPVRVQAHRSSDLGVVFLGE